MAVLSIGRIVHYIDDDGVHCAAIVLRVVESAADLWVISAEHADYRVFGILEGTAAGTWHWQEVV